MAANSHQEVIRFDISVDEIPVVDVLDASNHLKREEAISINNDSFTTLKIITQLDSSFLCHQFLSQEVFRGYSYVTRD